MENEIKEIMENILNVTIDGDVNKQSIDEWDSFHHIEILVCLEEKYNIKFSPEEMGSINSYKELCKIVSDKI